VKLRSFIDDTAVRYARGINRSGEFISVLIGSIRMVSFVSIHYRMIVISHIL
jgi:hypothetical protein